MSENKLTKLPPHLQEKLTDAAYSYEAPRHFNCYGCCQSDSDYEKSFESGYLKAYSDILQELGPVVEALEFYKEKSHCEDNCRSNDGAFMRCNCGFEAGDKVHRQALKHLKERFLP